MPVKLQMRLKKTLSRLADRLGLNARCKKQKSALEQASGCAYEKIVATVERALTDSEVIAEPLDSRFADLGGSNNLGFLLHRSEFQYSPLWVTKFAHTDMVQREQYFLRWHHEHVSEPYAIVPQLKSRGRFNPSDVEFLTVEALQSPGKIRLDEVVDLYVRMQKVGKIFRLQHGMLPEMKGGSRIRDILLSFVCDFGSETCTRYLKDFFDQRKATNSLNQREIEGVKSVVIQFLSELDGGVEHLFGWVHGDFKAANMMRDEEKRLKLVDLQYYLVGIRVWDLAFFLSKDKRSFEVVYPKVNSLVELPAEERQVLICCYILAVMLHMEPSNFKDKYRRQVLPAVMLLQKESVS